MLCKRSNSESSETLDKQCYLMHECAKKDTSNWTSSKYLQDIQMTLDIKKPVSSPSSSMYLVTVICFPPEESLGFGFTSSTFLKHVSVVMYILWRCPHSWWLGLLPEQLFVPSCSVGATVTLTKKAATVLRVIFFNSHSVYWTKRGLNVIEKHFNSQNI